GVIVATVDATALIESGVAAIGGASVTIASALQTDAASAADGSATDASSLGIGAAVALTKLTARNSAILPVGVTVTGAALTVSATVAIDGADATSEVSAAAAAGSGGGTVSVAGSVGIALVDT